MKAKRSHVRAAMIVREKRPVAWKLQGIARAMNEHGDWVEWHES
jgi:hypothetical protein